MATRGQRLFILRVLILVFSGYALLSLGLSGLRPSISLVTIVALTAAAWAILRFNFQPRLWIRVLLITLIGATAFNVVAVWESGYGFLWLYLIPPMAFVFFGHGEGILWTIGTLTAMISALTLGAAHIPDSTELMVGYLCSFSIASIFAFEVEWRRRLYARQLIHEKRLLDRAVSDVETLHGFLPICASCKSIRDDKGYWSTLDAYLSEHSLAEIAEAQCPDCRPRDQSTRIVKTREALLPTQKVPQVAEGPLQRLGYLSFCLTITALVAMLFGIFDLWDGRPMKGGLEIGAGFVFLILLPLNRHVTHRVPLDHGYALSASALLLYELATRGSQHHALLWMLVMPYVFYAILPKSAGTAWALILLIATAIIGLGVGAPGYLSPAVLGYLSFYSAVAWICFLLQSYGEKAKRRLQKETMALADTLERVTTLRGLIPLCPACKNIRDDLGFWKQVESYLMEETGTTLSHGLCPDCAAGQLRLLKAIPTSD